MIGMKWNGGLWPRGKWNGDLIVGMRASVRVVLQLLDKLEEQGIEPDDCC